MSSLTMHRSAQGRHTRVAPTWSVGILAKPLPRSS